jgi:hypothetical protein
MERVKVQSRNIESIGWEDPGTLGQPTILEVEFKGKGGKPGSVYTYTGVPIEVWHGLLHAPSKGVFFSSQIKSRYPATKAQ